MKRSFILVVALAALSLSIPSQAQTRPPHARSGPVELIVRVANHTPTRVWISVAYAQKYTPWTWMKETHNTARFVHPGGFYDFSVATFEVLPVAVPMEAKVEGTFMTNADCTGKHEREITVENKGIFANHNAGSQARATSTLSGNHPSEYHISLDNVT